MSDEHRCDVCVDEELLRMRADVEIKLLAHLAAEIKGGTTFSVNEAARSYQMFKTGAAY